MEPVATVAHYLDNTRSIGGKYKMSYSAGTHTTIWGESPASHYHEKNKVFPNKTNLQIKTKLGK